MSLLLSILNGIKTLRKIKKDIGKDGILSRKHILKIVFKSIYPIVIETVLVVTVIAAAIYTVTGAIGELFNWFKNDYGSSSSPPSSYYEGLTDEEIEKILKETGANLDPKRIPKYMQFESESLPSDIEGTQITKEGEEGVVKSTTKETVTIDVSQYHEKYKVNWEFLASVDIASFNANEKETSFDLKKAKPLISQFEWYDSYTRETTDTQRVWTETYEHDSSTGVTTQIGNTYDSSKETFTTIIEPLAIPKIVRTMFGDYTYTVNEDVVVKNEPYSSPFVVDTVVTTRREIDRWVTDYSSPIYEEDEEGNKVFKGYDSKPVYKTITTTTKTMKKTKQKIVEDIANEPNLNFNPTKFIKYINDYNLSVKDIVLIKETMTNIPNGNFLLDNLERIANGSYGDIGIGNGIIPGGVLGGFNFSIPLFIQWDSRWGGQPYAGETIGIAGCAPTSMAMVITGLEGNMNGIDLNNDGIVDPSEAAKWSTDNGYAAYLNGSYDSLIPSLAKAADLTVEQTLNANTVYNALKEGKVVVANVVPGTIINGLHFLVLTGVNNDGTIRMNDPYSEANSQKNWPLETIKRESQNFWIIDNPNADIYDENLTTQELLIAKVRRGAIATYHQFGVLPSITIAQAAEESGWGTTTLATKYNNLFGIKADSRWTGEKVALTTGENYNDTIVAYFRVYNTWAEGIYDHGLFIYENSRYAEYGFFNAKDYKGQAQALEDAGYATLKDEYGNPIYADHLISIIEDFNLYELDEYVKKLN